MTSHGHLFFPSRGSLISGRLVLASPGASMEEMGSDGSEPETRRLSALVRRAPQSPPAKRGSGAEALRPKP